MTLFDGPRAIAGTTPDYREDILEWASVLTTGCDDPAAVHATALVLLGWIEANGGDPADLRARHRAMAQHLDNLSTAGCRRRRAAGDDSDDTSAPHPMDDPAAFLRGAEALYLFLAHGNPVGSTA